MKRGRQLRRLRALAEQVPPALGKAQPSVSIRIVAGEVGLLLSVCRLPKVLFLSSHNDMTGKTGKGSVHAHALLHVRTVRQISEGPSSGRS
jgi:hypothetical protein